VNNIKMNRILNMLGGGVGWGGVGGWGGGGGGGRVDIIQKELTKPTLIQEFRFL